MLEKGTSAPSKNRAGKREKFVELAENRTRNAIRAIRVIGKLGNKHAYEYDDSDVSKIVRALSKEIDALKARMTKGDKRRRGFQPGLGDRFPERQETPMPLNAPDLLSRLLTARTTAQVEAITASLPIIPPEKYQWVSADERSSSWQTGKLHWVPVGGDRGNGGRIKLAGEPMNPLAEQLWSTAWNG